MHDKCDDDGWNGLLASNCSRTANDEISMHVRLCR